MRVNDREGADLRAKPRCLLTKIPMHRFPSAALLNLFAVLLLAGALPLAHGAELADPVVRSYMGQPLVADIELTALTDPGQAVVVRLAHPDVFKGANIRMHAALPSVTMSVMRRDGRQFLHITSTRPIESEYLHLFLELADGSRRDVRLATLWLAPDPAPPPPPPPPAPVKPVAPIVVVPPAPAPAPAVPAARVVAAPPARLLAPPAACPRPQVVPAAPTCSPLEYKNGLLSAQIVELEEKVRALEQAMHEKGAALPTAAPPVVKAPAAAPRPVSKKQVDEPFPWLLVAGIGAAVIALAAGGFGFLRFKRARAARGAVDSGDEPAAPATESARAPWYQRLRERFRRAPAPAADDAAPAVIEP